MMLMVLVTTVAAQRPVALPDAGCAAVRVAESPCGSTLWACVEAFASLGSGGGSEGVTARFMVGSATAAGTDPGRELNLVEEEVAFSRLPIQETGDASRELFEQALARCTLAPAKWSPRRLRGPSHPPALTTPPSAIWVRAAIAIISSALNW